MRGYESAPRFRELVTRLTANEEPDLVPPGLILELDRPEWKFLARTVLAAGGGVATSIATTLPEVGLFNFTTRLIATITRLRIQCSIANAQMFYTLFRGTALPAGFTINNSGPIDTRDLRLIAAGGGSALQAANATNLARSGGTPFDSILNPAVNALIEDLQPIVLAPNTGLIISKAIVEVATLTVNFRWYERGSTAEELAL